MVKQSKQHSRLPAIQDGLSKAQISKLANSSIENVLEEGNVAQVAEAIAVMEEFIKQVRKNDHFIDFMRDELIRNNGKINTPSGARIEMCEAGVAYDYSEDTTWSSMDAEIKALVEERKKIEEKLRKIGPGKMMVDNQTGEVMVGPIKSSRSTYRITLSK